MNHPIRMTLALVAGLFAVSALAATSPTLSASAQAAHAAAVAAQTRVAHVRAASPVATGAVQPKVMGTQTYPGSPTANPFRAYPPSCAADPLPDAMSGPYYQTTVPLFATNQNNSGTLETATVTVWRLACSSSGAATPYNPNGYQNAMTLMRIDRADDSNGTITPRFPLVQVSQGDVAFSDARSAIRVAVEPNTVISDTPFDSPVRTSTTYVLENYPYQGSGYFTYSDAFTLRINPKVQGVTPVDINVPAYSPTPSTYPDATNPLPIDGYLGTAWFDPAHAGEGLLINVFDNADGVSRTVFAAWYTYDAAGLPFWLVAQKTVQAGDVSTGDMPVYYHTGGGFAGSFGASSTAHPWGTLSLTFPDCNLVHLAFSGQTDAQTGGPAGTGTRDWQRLANNNGMTCE